MAAQQVEITNWSDFDYAELAKQMKNFAPTTQIGTKSDSNGTATREDELRNALSGGGDAGGSGVPGGGGGPPGSTVGGTILDETNKSKADLMGALVEFADATVTLSNDTMRNFLKGFKEFEDSGVLQPYETIQKSLGLTVKEFSRVNSIQNQFTRGELVKFKDMHKEFLQGRDGMIDYFETDKKYMKAMHELQEKMINNNTRSLESFTKDERKRALLFQNNLNLASDSMVSLLDRTYAYSGDTNTEILDNIVRHAKAVGDATGIAFKDLADETSKILMDTERFANMSEATATRIAATYKQLGLDLRTFGSIIDGFRDFDSAARKMGDLSAMFGVQMDAMEMMYLANEDEEEFLHRFRDQLMDQGVDVENMSKTRLRALGDQLGMTQRQLQTFFREGELAVSQADQEKATAEGAQMTVKDTTELIKGQKRIIERTPEAWAAIYKSRQFMEYRDEIVGLVADTDRMRKNITRGVTRLPTGKDGPLGEQFSNFLNLMKTGARKIGKANLEDIKKQAGELFTLGEGTGPIAKYFGEITTDGQEVLGDAVDIFSQTINNAFGEQSAPPILYGATSKDHPNYGVGGIAGTKKYLGSEEFKSHFLPGVASIDDALLKPMEERFALASENINNAFAQITEEAAPGDISLTANATLKKESSIPESIATMSKDIKGSIEVLDSNSISTEDLNKVTLALENTQPDQEEIDRAVKMKEITESMNTLLTDIKTHLSDGKATEISIKLDKEVLTKAVLGTTLYDGRTVVSKVV